MLNVVDTPYRDGILCFIRSVLAPVNFSLVTNFMIAFAFMIDILHPGIYSRALSSFQAIQFIENVI